MRARTPAAAAANGYHILVRLKALTHSSPSTRSSPSPTLNPASQTPHPADQRAFVITLARAGEDFANFKLTDTDTTFQGFAGADYALQVCKLILGTYR